MFFRRSVKKNVLEDGELIQLFKKTGELSYVGELYQRYVHLVFGVCMKYLKNEEESKDMSMQVFEKLIDQLKKHEVNNFKSWLHVLVKNQCLMLLRSKHFKEGQETSKFVQDDDMEFEYQLHPIVEEGKEEELIKMEEGLEFLPIEQKQCVRLFYLEEKCYKEISEITGYDLNKVKSYIQNGKRNLKNYIEKNKDEDIKYQ